MSNMNGIEKSLKFPNYKYTYYYDIYDKIINTYKINPNVLIILIF